MDRTFGGSDWKQTLQDSLDASFKARNESEAMDVIDIMLKKLGKCQTLGKEPAESGRERPAWHEQCLCFLPKSLTLLRCPAKGECLQAQTDGSLQGLAKGRWPAQTEWPACAVCRLPGAGFSSA